MSLFEITIIGWLVLAFIANAEYYWLANEGDTLTVGGLIAVMVAAPILVILFTLALLKDEVFPYTIWTKK